MTEKQPTQRTPKGAEIPIPRRDDLMRDMRKIVKAKPQTTKSSTPDRPAE